MWRVEKGFRKIVKLLDKRYIIKVKIPALCVKHYRGNLEEHKATEYYEFYSHPFCRYNERSDRLYI